MAITILTVYLIFGVWFTSLLITGYELFNWLKDRKNEINDKEIS